MMRQKSSSWAVAGLAAIASSGARGTPLLLLLLLTGCATERAMIRFGYVVEPDRGLPPGMKTIAVLPARVGPATDPKWSEISANLLQSLVNESHQQFGTDVSVSDRRDVQATFDEADLTAAGLTTAETGRGGRLLANQGVILSNISVKVEKHVGKQRTISGFDLAEIVHHGLRGRQARLETEEVETVTRNLTVQTDFKLIDTANNRVWEQYSNTFSTLDRTKASPLFGASQTEAALAPRDQLIQTFVEQGARAFLSRLMRCRIEVVAEVSSSLNKHCVRGVKLLRADAYADALRAFQTALDANWGDHRAAFGAGLACEALGRYEKALRFYNRALAERDRLAYASARDRVKAYGGRAAAFESTSTGLQ